MLSLLHIENIAVIESADIAFDRGLTVLSGETGAGKSIVLDAIGALLGRRTSRELIRSGAEKGFVSAVFTDLSAALRQKLEELSLSGDEPDTLQIQRQFTSDGKTLCRVNLRPVPVAALKALSPYLIDIHGQHDGQRLLDERCHIEFLDQYCGLHSLLTEYRTFYHRLTALKHRITMLEHSNQERLQRIDMLQYQAQEIADAALVPGEEAELQAKKAVFDHAGALLEALEKAHAALDGIELEVPGAVELLGTASDALSGVAELSPELGRMSDAASELTYLAQDLQNSIAVQRAHVEFSPEERAAVEERLDILYRLKQKYGGTIEEVIAAGEKTAAELLTLQHADETRADLREKYHEELVRAKALAARLTAARQEGARRLSERIGRELSELDMTHAQVEIAVDTGKKLGVNGMNTVRFLISVNPGEPVKPLAKIASGGELSRIMLAMKHVLTEGEPVGTLIFDEIDTGVGGRAAQRIAHKLLSISRKKQTLCVTHLPQIAAMGDTHLLIAKQVRGDRSYTEVTPLPPEQRTCEIARMMAGDRLTDATLASAGELLSAAAAAKEGLHHT